MRECMRFARHASLGGKMERGVVKHVDPSVFTIMSLVNGEERVTSLSMPHCCEPLCNLVSARSDAFWIESLVCQNSTASLMLMSSEEEARALLQEGKGADVEESVVRLVCAFWPAAVVPPPADPGGGLRREERCTPAAWNAAFKLYPFQEQSAAWMASQEERFPVELSYSENVRVCDGWYVDVQRCCVTTDPNRRTARLVGGVCADGLGSGKTATALRLMAADGAESRGGGGEAYESRASLVIVPLNIVSQWKREMDRCLQTGGMRIVWLLQSKDIRSLCMQDLLDCDVVLTTFAFFKTNAAYLEMLDHQLQGRARERPSLSVLKRRPGCTLPILELVHWRRVVVDEMHDVLANPKEMKHLQLLSRHAVWGLTATPILDGPGSEQLCMLLERDEPALHPNLLQAIVEEGVRNHSPVESLKPDHVLMEVPLSADEKSHFQAMVGEPIDRLIRRCTFLDMLNENGPSCDREAAALAEELLTLSGGIEYLEEQVRAAERESASMATLGRTHRRDVLSLALRSHGAQLQLLRDEQAAKERELRAKQKERQRPTPLPTACQREGCGRQRDVHLKGCGHAFCVECVPSEVADCHVCGQRGEVVLLDTIGSRVMHIVRTILSIKTSCVVFVQWKGMLRGLRTFMGRFSIEVFVLDGSVQRRSGVLSKFQEASNTEGRVLLLCLDDCFAGLHLPQVHHILFAHAIVADRNRVTWLEKQAIARCLRPGQTKEVHVYSFLIPECGEMDLWARTHDQPPR